MKLMRILTLPFAAAVDVATCGNIGGERSFVQQVFDAERREQRRKGDAALVRELVDVIKALK